MDLAWPRLLVSRAAHTLGNHHRQYRRRVATAGWIATATRLIAIVLLIASLGLPSSALAGSTLSSCDIAAARAERDWSLPAGVLSAVGTVESGRGIGPLGSAPWPWTINAAGRGSYHGSKAEAVAAVLEIMGRGFLYIDVGCFQIDLAYHAGVFRSLDDAFDPERNAQEAARILASERLRSPDWATAVARYHSATPELGAPYLRRVRDALPAARTRASNAEFEAALEASAATEAKSSLPAPAVNLPKVIYAIPPMPLRSEPQHGPGATTAARRHDPNTTKPAAALGQ